MDADTVRKLRLQDDWRPGGMTMYEALEIVSHELQCYELAVRERRNARRRELYAMRKLRPDHPAGL